MSATPRSGDRAPGATGSGWCRPVARRSNHAIVALSGYPLRRMGWSQFRAFGAASLDLCAVAEGRRRLRGRGRIELGSWDYLGGMLVCTEAGAVRENRRVELVEIDHAGRAGRSLRPRRASYSTRL